MLKSLHKTRGLLFITLLCTVLHFIASSIYGHYIAKQVGAEMGNVVAQGLSKTYTSSDSSTETEADIHKEMKREKDQIYKRWKIHFFILSLPSGPVMNSLWQAVRKNWIYAPLHAKEISSDECIFRGKIIDNLAGTVNSLSFGILLYILFRLWSWRKQRKE